jgi:hypothetical protein
MKTLRRHMPLVVAPVLALAAAVLISAAPADVAGTGGNEGKVRFVRATGPDFDRHTSTRNPAVRRWIRRRFWRMLVYSSYFDRKTSWYPRGWMYQDLHAIYRRDGLVRKRPGWILRDARGHRLYISWGCDDGVCPQYAGDPGNQSFRRWWIEQARRKLAHGYKGLWIDDVNLEMRISDGDGDFVAPIDPRTRREMTESDWRRYVAGFAREVRRALPGVEIVHNAIWFAAPDRAADPDVRRQIRAADYVNLERGVNDGGITGGDGPFSLRALLDYVDDVHALGSAVVFEGHDSSAQGREYSLATYLLVNEDRDAVGLNDGTPRRWWRIFESHLGHAYGERYDWEGLLRRDFTRGLVLVNEPDAPTRTVTLPLPMRDAAGRTVTSVTLPPAGGAVLRAPEGELGRTLQTAVGSG